MIRPDNNLAKPRWRRIQYVWTSLAKDDVLPASWWEDPDLKADSGDSDLDAMILMRHVAFEFATVERYALACAEGNVFQILTPHRYILNFDRAAKETGLHIEALMVALLLLAQRGFLWLDTNQDGQIAVDITDDQIAALGVEVKFLDEPSGTQVDPFEDIAVTDP